MGNLPKYQYIINDIKNKILKNIYKIDEKIPTENELAEIYGVSRMTVNKALLDLQKDDYIYKIQGSGTYIKRRIINKEFGSSISFSSDISDIGSIPGSKLLEFSYIDFKENPTIFKNLNLNNDDKVLFFKRLRLSDNKPVAISSTYISQKVIPELDADTLSHSFYEYIQKKFNVKPICRNYIISATLADDFQKAWLKVKNEALLKVSHYSYTQDGTAFEYNETYYLSDRFTYITNGDGSGINHKKNS